MAKFQIYMTATVSQSFVIEADCKEDVIDELDNGSIIFDDLPYELMDNGYTYYDLSDWNVEETNDGEYLIDIEPDGRPADVTINKED